MFINFTVLQWSHNACGLITKSCRWFDVQILGHVCTVSCVVGLQSTCVCNVHVRVCIVKLSEFTMRSVPKRPMSGKIEIEEK